MKSFVVIAREIDESVPDVGRYGMVSQILFSRDNTGHRGTRLGVQEGQDVVRITVPCRVAFGVRSVGVKYTMSAMVKNDESTLFLVGNGMVSHPDDVFPRQCGASLPWTPCQL